MHAGIWSNCPSDRTDRLLLRHVCCAQRVIKLVYVWIWPSLMEVWREKDIPQQVWNMFITPYGHFCLHPLRFVIKSAPTHYQRRASVFPCGASGVVCMIDDILVHVKSRVEHEKCLRWAEMSVFSKWGGCFVSGVLTLWESVIQKKWAQYIKNHGTSKNCVRNMLLPLSGQPNACPKWWI